MATMQKITSNLWFDRQAEKAANFYVTVFKDSAILRMTRYGKEGYEIHNMPEGTVMTVEFQLAGQKFVALNGGPIFRFSEAISFVVSCDNQEEVDYYWEKLAEGGDPNAQQCGWLKDQFGLSWQIVPAVLTDMMHDDDYAGSQRVVQAMLKMKKLEIDKLVQAFEDKG